MSSPRRVIPARRRLSAVLLLPLVLVILPPSVVRSASRPVPPGELIALAGSAMPNLSRVARLGALSARTPMGIGVALRLRHHRRLETLVRQVSDPRSPRHGHFLSVAEFRSRFAPTALATGRVRAWLRSSGLRVTYVSPNGLLIQARGTAGAVQRAFHTRLDRYRQNHAFYANPAPVKVPKSVAGTVEAVIGLDNRYRISRSILKRAANARPRDPSSDFGYTPTDLQKIYNLTPLLNSGTTGSGETIGIVAYKILPADITTFEQEYALPHYVPQQMQVKDPRNHGQYGSDWTAVAEAELDTEISHGAAPGANIILYEDANEQLDSIYYSFAQMVSQNRVQVISSSVGGPESHWASFPRVDLVSATHDVLLEAAAQGQTVMNASGDSGAFDAASDGRASQTELMVDYPCSDPEVTCVGGTSVRDTATGDYSSETVWADGSDPANPEGSGGGISQLFGRPPWQTGPGTDNSYSAADTGRMIPDVSADADPQTGYAVFIVNVHLVGEDDEFGGTSAAAPMWAGLAALLVQSFGKRIGFFNPTLYALGAQSASLAVPPFHDITTGNNLYYPATTGYDLATGWGTPDAAALAADLKQLGHTVLTPIVVVRSAGVQQKKNGTYVSVKTVSKGKSARFTASYNVTNPAGPVTGKLQIFKGSTSVGTWKLIGPGSASGTMKRSRTLKKAGSYSAVLTIADAGYSTSERVKFKVK